MATAWNEPQPDGMRGNVQMWVQTSVCGKFVLRFGGNWHTNGKTRMFYTPAGARSTVN